MLALMAAAAPAFADSLLDLRATLSSAAAKYKTPVPQQKTQGDT